MKQDQNNIRNSVLFALMLALVAFGLGFAQHYHELRETAQKAEEIIQEVADERDQLRRERDSLKRLANLRHPETRWLARVVYSETNRTEEMWLVAWEVRNRVEHSFRGKDTYRGVALDPKQYSAFNDGRLLREYYMTKNWMDVNAESETAKTWKTALKIANRVRTRSPVFRPFSDKVFNHYSQVSMPSWKPHPDWRSKFVRVDVDGIDPMRMRFYKDPECRLCGGFNTDSGMKTASIEEKHKSLTID